MFKEQKFKYVIIPEPLKLAFSDSDKLMTYTLADWVGWLVQFAEKMVDTQEHMRIGAYILKQTNEATMKHWEPTDVPHIKLLEDAINYFTSVIETLGQDSLPSLGYNDVEKKNVPVPLLKNLEFIDSFVDAKNVAPENKESENTNVV